MLYALVNFSYSNTTVNTIVKTPHLYLFDQATKTQILEDFYDTTDLKTVLLSHRSISSYPGGSPASLGRTLGGWLRCFHSWTSATEQENLRVAIGRNKGMRRLKRQITYDSFLRILKLYPQIVEGHLESLQAAQDGVNAEFEVDQSPMDGGDERGLIHGDFWSGK